MPFNNQEIFLVSLESILRRTTFYSFLNWIEEKRMSLPLEKLILFDRFVADFLRKKILERNYKKSTVKKLQRRFPDLPISA
jgi:hypothetical protein